MEAFFAVLNPGGRDPARCFPDGPGSPAAAGHAPINYHAYAACCHGGFYREAGEIPEGTKAVLVLLRRNGLKDALKAVVALRQRRVKAWISWKESGLHQIAAALADAGRWRLFGEVCREADGFLASTPELPPLYRGAGCEEGEFLPTPYPVECAAWDFSIPLAERAGIFIGTREFDVGSRHHLLAVTAAGQSGFPVTVLNADGRRGGRLLRAVAPRAQIVPGPLSYPDYLRLMARHRVVFQLDRSAVPGQVAGDALLCRLPCVGGDGAVERIAFPDLTGFGRSAGDLQELLSRLMVSDPECRQAVERSQGIARREVSFEAIRARLRRLALGE